MHKPNK